MNLASGKHWTCGCVVAFWEVGSGGNGIVSGYLESGEGTLNGAP